ncbi:MAG: hypothetical protein H6733_01470 [Alphaproteobacteria bacterium]|nr:hypothetical protein [Alphaproteobacteria bacterium]
MHARSWCLATVLAAGCGGGLPDSWEVLGSNLDEALLSITGTSSSDVWSVGGDVGSGPAVLHYDGTSWSKVDTGDSGDLWWVFEASQDELWFVGADGRALHHTPSSDTTDVFTLNTDTTYFGIWGAAANDVWTVGGNIDVASAGASMYHWDGSAWSEVTLPEAAANLRALYKVWGSSASDVWVVGTDGALLHYDGSAWSMATSPTDRTLFTVHGTASDDVWAVGGSGSGVLLHYDGSAWTDVSPTAAPAFTGIYAAPDHVFAVGATGGVWASSGGDWAPHPAGLGTPEDLHGAWVDETGALWAVGGSVASFPLDLGVMLYAGGSAPAAITP